MKNFSQSATIISAILILSISCTKNSSQLDISTPVVLPANGENIIHANNNFAFDFFHATLQTDISSKNKLISPLSIYFALSMLYNGADGTTKDSIQYALRSQGINIDDINNTCKALLKQLPLADNKVDLSIANSIWYHQTLQPLQSFLDINSNYYTAKVQALDFYNPSSVSIINNWISQQTKDKINNVLTQLVGNLYLINAIYFKGAWKIAFDKKSTINSQFITSNGTIVSTPFMNMKQSLKYLCNDTLQMLELPYGGGNFNMYVMLPNIHTSIVSFAALLNRQNFSRWQSNLDSATISLYLPKFSYAYSIDDMKPELAKMGMNIAFTDSANFSKMYNGSSKISDAIHKTYINVDESGTEAAAVTVIGIITTSLFPTMNVNHPFVYVIQEKTSGEILFIGTVNNPANT